MAEETENNEKRSLFDERYRIPGSHMFSMSQWSRENEPKPDHQFKVGDMVVLTLVVEVTALTRDCDGTALYTFDGDMRGYPEEGLRLATEEEAKTHW